jgi:hypothetical protein
VHRAADLFVTQTNIDKHRATYSMLVRAKGHRRRGGPSDLYLNDTIQETNFIMNSERAAQCTVKFPNHYVRTTPVTDGSFVGWQVETTEEDVVKVGANEIVQATCINSPAAFLVGA